jgi:hypothetical protein
MRTKRYLWEVKMFYALIISWIPMEILVNPHQFKISCGDKFLLRLI